MYEKHELKVDEKLVGQYLQNQKIAKDFAIYYDLFDKYRSDYQVDSILAGKASAQIKERAKTARFDERLALLGLILDAVTAKLRDVMDMEGLTFDLMAALKRYRAALSAKRSASPAVLMRQQAEEQRRLLKSGQKAASLSQEQKRQKLQLIQILEDLERAVEREADGTAAFQTVKKTFYARGKDI